MKRRKRIIVDFDALLAANATLRRQHDLWSAWGYVITSFRGWRCRDGSATFRVVWRNDAELVSSVVATLRGQALP